MTHDDCRCPRCYDYNHLCVARRNGIYLTQAELDNMPTPGGFAKQQAAIEAKRNAPWTCRCGHSPIWHVMPGCFHTGCSCKQFNNLAEDIKEADEFYAELKKRLAERAPA